MSWRTVVISKRCKLDLKMGYLVVRDESITKVFLDEISILVIENTAVSITGCLIAALIEKKIKVIFCDEKRNPSSELIPYYGSHDCSRKIKTQVNWTADEKAYLWMEIVSEKIRNQANFLLEIDKNTESKMLQDYVLQMEFNDASNREGHAAKVYFNAVFGMEFTRTMENSINAALNYGYSLILSTINREVVANGYLTQLGIFHDNMFNQFNLSCDLMEPFRILVDRKVYYSKYTRFETEEKHAMLNLLNENVIISGTNQTTLNALKIYTKSVFDAINDKDSSLVAFAKYKV